MMTMIYIVCRDREEARRVSRSLLEKRLAACTNMFPIESMYWWQGKLVEDTEFVVIAKTLEENFAAIVADVKAVHSYEVPAIIRLAVGAVESRYLAWLEAETELRPTG